MLRGKIKNEYWRKLDMNKQEILEEINKTEEHLANMEKMLAECEYERWKPKNDDIFYYIDTFCRVKKRNWADMPTYRTHYNKGNCFKTYEEAEAEAEKILVRRMLEDIAESLNKGEKIDWEDTKQGKYYIYLDAKPDSFFYGKSVWNKYQGVVYCLDQSFLDVATQKIGEERLKKYLRGE